MTPSAFKFLQKQLGANGKDLASLFDVSAETISRWRNGKQRIPRAVAMVMLERASRVQPEV